LFERVKLVKESGTLPAPLSSQVNNLSAPINAAFTWRCHIVHQGCDWQ
jgi:hypothetical protein